jgi:hypothetical protein
MKAFSTAKTDRASARDATQNLYLPRTRMTQYRFAVSMAEADRDRLTISLRRDGYMAWRDDTTLFTDAIPLAIGLTHGNPFWRDFTNH